MFNQAFKSNITKNLAWLLADMLMFGAYLLFMPKFSAFFNEKSLLHGIVIVLVYLVFCFSVVLIKKLPVEHSKETESNRSWLSFFAVFFGVFIVYIIADSSGFFANLDSMPDSIDGWNTVLLFGGVIVGLFLAFLYLIVILKKVKPFFSTSVKVKYLAEFSALLGVNLMIITITAFWNATFSGVEPYDDLTMGGKILIFIFVYLFFLLFFAPPRMLFLLKKTNNYSWLTFFAQTMYFVWDSLSRLAW